MNVIKANNKLYDIKKLYEDWFNTDLDGENFRILAEQTMYKIGEVLKRNTEE